MSYVMRVMPARGRGDQVIWTGPRKRHSQREAARGCWGNDELNDIREIDETEVRNRRGGLRGMANWMASEKRPPLRAPLREAVGEVTTNRTVSEGSL